MNDDLAQLADDYWQAILDEEPTERHMLGDYSDVGSYEQVSREAEDALRRDAARLRGPGRGGRRRARSTTEERLTRGVLIISSATPGPTCSTPR